MPAFQTNLWETACVQWHLGDWHALAQLTHGAIESDPKRAQLAMLVSAAHQQLDHGREASRFHQLGKGWGCDARWAVQILVASIHNAMGRAAAAMHDEPRALKHFHAAVAGTMAATDVSRIARARAVTELGELELTGLAVEPAGTASGIVKHAPRATAQDDRQSFVAMREQVHELNRRLEQQSSEINRLQRAMQSGMQKEVQGMTRQLEDYLRLQAYTRGEQLMPPMHGWAISPDFGVHLLQIIEHHPYDFIIEFGSGTSTLIIAQALERAAAKGLKRARQLAFEHLDKYRKATHALLKNRDLHGIVELVPAPLLPYSDNADGDMYQYYDCAAALAMAAANATVEPALLDILVVVDGPPAATGRHARYPALPHVLNCFPHARLDILLDDYIRDDEKEIEAKWLALLKAGSRVFEVTHFAFEKGATQISVERSRPEDRPPVRGGGE
jgi:TolA-binding protein